MTLQYRKAFKLISLLTALIFLACTAEAPRLLALNPSGNSSIDSHDSSIATPLSSLSPEELQQLHDEFSEWLEIQNLTAAQKEKAWQEHENFVNEFDLSTIESSSLAAWWLIPLLVAALALIIVEEIVSSPPGCEVWSLDGPNGNPGWAIIPCDQVCEVHPENPKDPEDGNPFCVLKIPCSELQYYQGEIKQDYAELCQNMDG